MPTLFDPITLGSIEAPNRILMAPLTRGRATAEHVPTPLMVDYYRQRSGAGLIISEATGISRQGLGWPYAPGLWSDAQVAAWTPVTRAVHAAGGRIVAQLWHMGRVGHHSVNGEQPVSSSATQAPGDAHTYTGKQRYPEARALDLSEIPGLLETYATAAKNAIRAGFDGVQIHAANGYLIDQFLRDGSNHRSDAYGGSVENRVRLLREAAQTVAGAIGAERTAVRLSPNGEIQGVNDSHPEALFPAAAAALADVGIAWLELREPRENATFGTPDRPPIAPAIRAAFGARPLVLNSDYSQTEAETTLAGGLADAIAFGRPFIANPDLPERFRRGLPLAEATMATWYSQGPEGYVDYPPYEDAQAAE